MLRRWGLPLVVALLSACGGGGGSGEGGATAAPPVSPPPVTSPAPVASFEATPLSGSVPLTVQYDAGGSTSGAAISSYRWEFGDGSAPGSGVSGSHVYAAAGTYTLTLTVTDAADRTASTSRQVTVSNAALPALAGLTEAEARATLAGLRLEPGLIHVSGSTAGETPTVISSSPAAGATPEPGSRVELVLSTAAAGNAPPIRLSRRVGRGRQTPAVGALVDDRLLLAVNVASTFELASGVARVADREATLVYSTTTPSPCEFDACYSGAIDLSGVPWGPQELVFRVTDVRGNYSELKIPVVHDARPRLTVVAPFDDSVALGTLAVDATCTDDRPGCRIEVLGPVGSSGSREHLVDAVGRVAATVDLSPWAGAPLDLLFRIFDSANQLTEVRRNIYVESSTRLRIVANRPGRILDADGQRTLHLESGDSGDRLTIHSRAAGTTETIPLPDGQRIDDRFARLTPGGAIFGATPVGSSSLDSQIQLWRAGALTPIGPRAVATTLVVAGTYAVWHDNRNVQRVDTGLGTSALVGTVTRVLSATVGADGTVVFSSDAGQLVRDRGGLQAILSNDPTRRQVDLVVDGDDVAYVERTTATPVQAAVALQRGLSARVLLTVPGTAAASAGSQQQVAGGWVAFPDFGAQQQVHIFRRAPDGSTVRVTDFSGSSRLDRLASNGELMLLNGTQRYFARGTALVPVSTATGRSFRLADGWYLAIGSSLLAVDTSSP